MRNLTGLSLLAFASLAPTAALAHPGPHRNEAAWLLVHALTHSDHLLVIVAAIAVALALAVAALFALEAQR
ncbi:MAG TPA: hypothetical protein VEH76_12040 [Methylocystis sp.]|nr:hypothetical protein [Methylocystis sp.]